MSPIRTILKTHLKASVVLTVVAQGRRDRPAVGAKVHDQQIGVGHVVPVILGAGERSRAIPWAATSSGGCLLAQGRGSTVLPPGCSSPKSDCWTSGRPATAFGESRSRRAPRTS